MAYLTVVILAIKQRIFGEVLGRVVQKTINGLKLIQEQKSTKEFISPLPNAVQR